MTHRGPFQPLPFCDSEVSGHEQHSGLCPRESSTRQSFWSRDKPETHPCLAETCSDQLLSTLPSIDLCPTRF